MVIFLASWINRQQQEVIEYLRTENQLLKEKSGNKRILLDDDQRRRLAVKSKILGRKQLQQFGTLFTPDTILRWHRQLIAQKWDYSDRKNKQGRPRIRQVMVDLTLQFAKENPTLGYARIAAGSALGEDSFAEPKPNPCFLIRAFSTENLNIGSVPLSLRDVKFLFVMSRFWFANLGR